MKQPTNHSKSPRSLWALMRCWFDGHAKHPEQAGREHDITWFRAMPFLLLHLSCLAVFWVGISWPAVLVACIVYAIRMFAITGFYHRYFSHKTFKTSRVVQALFAFVGASSVQRGPLWWAAHHRDHHRHSDTEEDIHSPKHFSFFRSHMGWFLTAHGYQTKLEKITDFAKFPELMFIDRFHLLAPLALGVSLYVLGEWLSGYGTSGWQMLVWGGCISTIVLFHATVTINSLAHVFGSRRFNTKDDSRNNLWLALITFGEGWHNNHHFFPGTARQGFKWWEVDLTWYVLKFMSWVRLVRDIKPIPSWVEQKMSP